MRILLHKYPNKNFVRYILWMLLTFLLCTHTQMGFAAMKPYQWEHVELRLTTQRAIGDKEKKNYAKYWKKACKQIGKNLTGVDSLYGYKMAKAYSCYDTKNQAAIIAGTEAPSKASWQILVVDSDQHLNFSAYYVAFEPPKVDLQGLGVQATAQLDASEKTMKALADPMVSKLIAMKLMDQIPVARPLGKLDDSGAMTFSPKEKIRPILPNPTPQYNAIALAYDSETKLWLPRLMGKMTLEAKSEDSAKKLPKNSDNKKSDPSQSDSFKWTFTKAPYLDAAFGEDLWLVDARGRGQGGVAIDEKLNDSLHKFGLSIDFISGMLLATISKGYVGFRMGANILPGEPLLDKAQMVGILAEFRAGPLKGLRWYWDFGPKVHLTKDGYTSSFTWSRPTLGWSFGKDLNMPLVTRIDIVPKIGLVDLDTSLVVDLADGSKLPLKYRVKNALNLGAELGIEKNTSWFLARLWGATDLANFGVAIGKDAISSYRAGVDTYWDVGNLTQSTQLALVVFGFGEMITLEKKKANVTVTADSSNAQITSLSYSMAFVGLGLTLGW